MSEMILDLCEDAKEYGRQALRAFESAGGDQLVQQAEAKTRHAGSRWSDRSSPNSARGNSIPVRTPTVSKPPQRCAAAPATGRCRTRSPSGWPVPPTSTSTV